MLELSDTQVTSSGLAPLARLKKLEAISLSWQTLTREDLQGMAKLKQLKTIVLNGVPLPEAIMAQLRGLGSPSPWDTVAGLEHAQLHDTRTTDQMVLGAPLHVTRSDSITPHVGTPTLLSSPATKASVSIAPGGKPSEQAMMEKKPMSPLKTASQPMSKEAELVSLPSKPDTIGEYKRRSSAPEPERLITKEPPGLAAKSSGQWPRGATEPSLATAPVNVQPKKSV